MESDTLEIKIAKAREEMSQESRQAIDAINWKQIILGMSSKFSAEQLENLETETELLLCGILSTIDYPKELEARMKISKNEVSLLLDEMDKLVFKKMQAELEKRINNEEIGGEKIAPIKKSFIPDPRFMSMPTEFQEAIYYSNWKQKIYEAAQKYKINIEQTGILEEITAKVMLNTIHNDQYENEIKSKITLPEDKIKEMVAEINENIFKNIKNIMVNKIIKNEELGIKNEKAGAKVPLPPYGIIKNEELGIKNEKPVQQQGGGIINNEKTDMKVDVKEDPNKIIIKNAELSMEDLHKSEAGLYMEHGIEILSDKNKVMLETKQETPVSFNTDKVDKPINSSFDNFSQSNVIVNKLSANTINQNTTTDYSLNQVTTNTKTEGVSTTKPHDPYHEQI